MDRAAIADGHRREISQTSGSQVADTEAQDSKGNELRISSKLSTCMHVIGGRRSQALNLQFNFLKPHSIIQHERFQCHHRVSAEETISPAKVIRSQVLSSKLNQFPLDSGEFDSNAVACFLW